MLYYFFAKYPNVLLGLGALTVFVLTAAGLHFFKDKLPADEGRDFAVDGKLTKGKPRGAGIVFILAFVIGGLLFTPVKLEYVIYVIIVSVEMLTGYMDDASNKPWGRLRKGLLDFVVALALAFTYVHYNGTSISIGLLNLNVTVPEWLFYILCVALVWASINVTNCADGVDGLSGTLVLITLASFMMADYGRDHFDKFSMSIVLFATAILAYLWFNAGPSILMMGDAGSRAMGVFVSIVALKSGLPILYIPFALVLILDGGLGLFKVTMIKITKKNDFMNKIRTPLHDHVRKKVKVAWSNNQVVTRFAIIQLIINILVLYIFVR